MTAVEQYPNSPPAINGSIPTRPALAGSDVQNATTTTAPAIPRRRSLSSRSVTLFDPALDTITQAVTDIETLRIALNNRVGTLTRVGADKDGVERGFGLPLDNPAVAALTAQLAQLAALEHGAILAMKREWRKHPLAPWVKAQVGLGEKQTARLLGAIKDPYWNDLHDRPRTVSELWAFCGLHVLPASHQANDTQVQLAGGAQRAGGDTSQHGGDTQNPFAGVAARRTRGQKANWNGEARSRAYVIAESCIKQRTSPYRATYDYARTKYADAVHAADCKQCRCVAGEPLKLGHQHARAMRLVMKGDRQHRGVLLDLWRHARDLHTEGTS